MKIHHNCVRSVVSAGLMVLALPAFAQAATAVDLGSAINYIILTKAGVSTTGTTHVQGFIGVSPIAATAITGFGLKRVAPTYSTSSLVTGKIFAANYAAPIPGHLTVAIGNMLTAYNDAAGRKNPNAIQLGAGNIGGLTIKPGLYKWSSNVNIGSNVTLSGTENGIWIFQIAGTLNVAAAKRVVLAGGALDKNIYWQVAGATTLGTTAVLHGTVLDKTKIVLKTGAKLYGRALAQTAVTLDASLVTP
jgi:Ice-binding-like